MNWAILGNSCSGKSTLSHRLKGEVFDLDTVAWTESDTPELRPESEVLPILESFTRSHSPWIIEGCYAHLIAPFDTGEVGLVFLDMDTLMCVQRARTRAWEPHKFDSKEEQDAALAYLLGWIDEYPSRKGPLGRPEHLTLFEKWKGPKWRITDDRDLGLLLHERA